MSKESISCSLTYCFTSSLFDSLLLFCFEVIWDIRWVCKANYLLIEFLKPD